MTICLFGNYLKDYPRVVTLRRGLESNDVRVLECHTRATGLKKYWTLYKKHRLIKNQYDFLIVSMGGQTLVWFAKLISLKKIIFDAFASLYLSGIEDRLVAPARSLRAYYYKFLDWWPCWLADAVLLDTRAQVNYYRQHYNLPAEKFFPLPISSDPQIFFPTPSETPSEKIIIHWHGHIVPFHSITTIISAAKLLSANPAIEFQIITRFNNKYKKIKESVVNLGLSNVKFYPETDYAGLAAHINRAAICLGIFGNNSKAAVVIPNKIIEAAACHRPIITVQSPAMAEFFSDRVNVLLCRPEDPVDLAAKVELLISNQPLRSQIAAGAYALYCSQLSPAVIARQLISFLEKI
ncbi:MAG TPA: glycosyltransferase [bacterium]|nr:glycosyltransferase [bacterium]